VRHHRLANIACQNARLSEYVARVEDAPQRALGTVFDRIAMDAPEAILRRAEAIFDAAGVTGAKLVLDAHLGPERTAALVDLLAERRDVLPVLAVEGRSGLHRAPALAALDREESRAAIGEAERTLRHAAACGAPYVVLRLGWVDGARRDWTHARDRFLRGRLSVQLARQMIEARDHVAHAPLDRARAALDVLGRAAERYGTTLLLKNGQRYVEMPSPREIDHLREDLQGAPLAPLFDLSAAHLTDVMSIWPLAVTEAAFGGGPVVYAGDACGAIAALPPGDGEMGRTMVSATLARQKDAVRVFRAWPGLSDGEVARGLAAIA
jgi:sugar phosphate isomerase/epimerase